MTALVGAIAAAAALAGTFWASRHQDRLERTKRLGDAAAAYGALLGGNMEAMREREGARLIRQAFDA